MKRFVTAFLVSSMLLANMAVLPASAESVPSCIAANPDAEIQAAGLLSKFDLTIQASNGQLCLNGTTRGYSEMKTIGFKDFKIEQSQNNSTWVTYDYKLDDILASNVSECNIQNLKLSVATGYYYRVTCTFYAKEKGLFGSSQSEIRTSNSIKV